MSSPNPHFQPRPCSPHPDAGGRHPGLDEMHRVVDCQPGIGLTTWAIDVHVHLTILIVLRQVRQLRDDQVGNDIVDGVPRNTIRFSAAATRRCRSRARLGWSARPPSVRYTQQAGSPRAPHSSVNPGHRVSHRGAHRILTWRNSTCAGATWSSIRLVQVEFTGANLV